MLVIPQIIDDTVPIGKDDTENVELERFGEPVVPDYEVPYHVDIMESVSGIDLDSSRKPRAAASTTCAATSPVCTPPFYPTPGTL